MKDRYKNLIDTALAPLRGFWQWWTAELDNIRRELFMRRKQGGADILLLRYEENTVYLSACIGQKWQPEHQFSLKDENKSTEDIKDFLASLAPTDQWQVILRLPREYCLAKPMIFPRAALGDLRDILVNQIDRLVPYRADQVYFDYHLRPQDYTDEQIKLDIFIVPRIRCASHLAFLDACGIAVNSLEIADISDRPFDKIDLVNGAVKGRGETVNSKWVWMAAAAVIVMAISPTAYNHYRISALEQNMGGSKLQARSSAQLKRNYQSLKQDVQYLVNRKNSRPLVLQVISAVSSNLGDDTWLEQLTIRKNIMQIFGYSAAATGVLADLEASSIFDNAHFISAVVQQKDRNVERFQVAAEVRALPEKVAESEKQEGGE